MPGAGAGPSGANQPRQSFRPPWVKDGPPPIPMPTQPWVKSNRTQNPTDNKAEASSLVTKALRKLSDATTEDTASAPPIRRTSKITITPSQPKENGLQNNAAPQESRTSVEIPIKIETAKKAPEAGAQKPPPKPAEPVKKVETKPQEKNPEPQPSRPRVLERTSTKDKYEGAQAQIKSVPPAAPPMPPAPPPFPTTKSEKPLTEEKRQKLEALRSRPKRRPDWGNMMKEIEGGRKLNHVKCNDRSAPLLPKVKAKGQFVYESEKPNLHNQLLKQIESGVKLKPTKTNDRSKPFIEGLRKFRRQMTIEEQIQKSASMASMGIMEVEPDPLDEVDDIDKVRDDLQSTKQMLALELKNKEALERENKKLTTRILNLEIELEKEKNRVKQNESGEGINKSETQKEMKSLREEAEKARKTADEMETKYHEVNDKLDVMKLDLNEALEKCLRLEKQLKVAQAANLQHIGQPVTKQPSRKIIHQNKVQESFDVDPDESQDESEETETETETESEVEGETEEAQNERRLAREIKLLTTKLKSFKTKREAAKKERKSLKEQMSKQQKAIKEEKEKYKSLQKEVDKMSKLMNEDDEEEEEEEEDEEEEEESSEEEEESEESESEESEGDLPESAPPEKKKVNLQNRTKKYENLLSSLKKGNYLLKANVERYKDEYNKQKEMTLTLQEDLNSVLAELG